MKQIVTVLFVAIILASCAPAATVVPTETAMPKSTITSIPPTLTLTSIPPTATELVIPDYMLSFIEQGFDKLSVDANTIYVVFHEDSTQYASEGGIKYKGKRIFSWTVVSYFENKIIKQGIVLDFTQNESGLLIGLSSFIDTSSTKVMPGPPSIAYVKATRNKINEFTVGDYPIALADIGSPDEAHALIFDDIFPEIDGVPQSITISGIGEVLPITRITYKSEVNFK